MKRTLIAVILFLAVQQSLTRKLIIKGHQSQKLTLHTNVGACAVSKCSKLISLCAYDTQCVSLVQDCGSLAKADTSGTQQSKLADFGVCISKDPVAVKLFTCVKAACSQTEIKVGDYLDMINIVINV